jgi:hypothetical protein
VKQNVVPESNPLTSNHLMAMLLGMTAGALQQVASLSNSIPTVDVVGQKKLTYPSIQSFFTKVIEENPLHAEGLKHLSTELANKDFYQIDEIAEENVEWFKSAPYGLTGGNAKFVINILKEAMMRTSNNTYPM